MMGSTEQIGTSDLLTPQQQQFLGQILGPQSNQMAGQAYQDMLQSPDSQQFGDMFQKSFVDPAQQTMQRQLIPGMKEQFMGMDESGSSALNQALSQSATDMSTALGGQYMNQYNQQQANRMQALGLGGNMVGQRTFDPIIQQQQGLAGPLIGAAGTALGGWASGGFSGLGKAVK